MNIFKLLCGLYFWCSINQKHFRANIGGSLYPSNVNVNAYIDWTIVLLLFQREYECSFTYASQGGTNEVSALPAHQVRCFHLEPAVRSLHIYRATYKQVVSIQLLSKWEPDCLLRSCDKRVLPLPHPFETVAVFVFVCTLFFRATGDN